MKFTWAIASLVLALPAVLAFQAPGQPGKDKKEKPKPSIVRPSLVPPGGEPKQPITVALKCATPGTTIRYTLDGSTPGADTGTLYSEPIPIAKATTVVAVAFKPNVPPSDAAVGTYLFDPKPGLTTFHIGNSLTNTTNQFPLFVRTAGYVPVYESFTAGGAWTNRLWNDTTKRKETWDALLAKTKKIDHFTVQPRDFDIPEEADYDIRFFNVIRKHSPEMQPWFYIEWVEQARQRPTDKAAVPSSQMKKLFPTLTWEESMSAMLLYGEELQLKVCETYKEGKRPRVLPSCLAMGWIKNMIDNGKLPGAPAGSFYPLLFRDQVHPNFKGGYLVDMTWYSAFYHASPEGKLLPAGTGLTPEQALVMQRLAWDVVKNYPDCGLYEEGTTPMAAPQFTQGIPGKEATPVTLSSKTPGAWFRYTLDGTVPTRTRGYVYCGVISARPGMTINAVAYKSGMADSPVAASTIAPGK